MTTERKNTLSTILKKAWEIATFYELSLSVALKYAWAKYKEECAEKDLFVVQMNTGKAKRVNEDTWFNAKLVEKQKNDLLLKIKGMTNTMYVEIRNLYKLNQSQKSN